MQVHSWPHRRKRQTERAPEGNSSFHLRCSYLRPVPFLLPRPQPAAYFTNSPLSKGPGIPDGAHKLTEEGGRKRKGQAAAANGSVLQL